MTLKNANTIDNFWAKVDIDVRPNGCWLWNGLLSPAGYARFNWRHKGHRAHKFSYEYFIGAVPEGMSLDHLCRVRHCVNPFHLEPVTPRENNVRGVGPKLSRERLLSKTHCKNDHPFTPENTYTTTGNRVCKACSLIKTKRYRSRLKCS